MFSWVDEVMRSLSGWRLERSGTILSLTSALTNTTYLGVLAGQFGVKLVGAGLVLKFRNGASKIGLDASKSWNSLVTRY